MEFEGLFITTHKEVYEPHDDTFLLARVVKERVRPGMRFVEVGCGAGLVALTAARAGATVVATDANPHAVALARHNGKQNRAAIEVVETDLLAGLAGPFDMVAFNPPYLPTAPDEKVSGPLNLAFDGGIDGNETVLRFAAQLVGLDPPPSEVLVVHSDLSDPAPLLAAMGAAGFTHEIVARHKAWFEELWVRSFRR